MNSTKALSMNPLNRDMQRLHLQHKHRYPAPTVLVKVEGNETLAPPHKYHHHHRQHRKDQRSMSRRHAHSFMGSTLSSTLQLAMEGISDPCRVSVWPPSTSSLTAAVTKRHTLDKVLKTDHNKSTTEWIQLYEPPVMLDSDDEGNTSSDSDDDGGGGFD